MSAPDRPLCRAEMKAALEKATRCGCSNCRKVFTVKMRTLVPQVLAEHDELLKLVASLRDWKSPDGVLRVKDLKWFTDLNV